MSLYAIRVDFEKDGFAESLFLGEYHDLGHAEAAFAEINKKDVVYSLEASELDPDADAPLTVLICLKVRSCADERDEDWDVVQSKSFE